MRLIIRDYSDEWPQRFAAERERLAAVLPVGAVVEHIGSTAVPGLAAKDIIDLMIGLPDFPAQAADVVTRIVDLGFFYVPRHEAVMPYRRFLHRSENGVRRCHIHMVGTGTRFWHDHLLFRDHLRVQARDRADYERLKRELAAREWSGMDDYASAKSDLVRAILAEAKTALGSTILPVVDPATKPIAHYVDWDPRLPLVTQALEKAMTPLPPFLGLEHVGSSAVPGCGGKGVIDLLGLYRPGHREAAKACLRARGFAPQREEFARRWPDERPMFLGYFSCEDTCWLVHVHVVDDTSDEVRRFRQFRDRLRADAALVTEYCALKRGIIATGVTNTDDYTPRKSAFFHQVLGADYTLRSPARET